MLCLLAGCSDSGTVGGRPGSPHREIVQDRPSWGLVAYVPITLVSGWGHWNPLAAGVITIRDTVVSGTRAAHTTASEAPGALSYHRKLAIGKKTRFRSGDHAAALRTRGLH